MTPSRIALAAQVLVSTLLAAPVWGMPVLSLDLDPSTAGIQSSLELAVGATFAVDLVLSDLAGEQVQAYQAALGFDASILEALGAGDGGLLPPTVVELEESVELGGIRFAVVSTDPAGTSSNGVLASFELRAIGEGTTSLELADALLVAPFGIPLPIADVRGGTVTAVVPEPGAVMLFAAGFLVFGVRRRTLAR